MELWAIWGFWKYRTVMGYLFWCQKSPWVGGSPQVGCVRLRQGLKRRQKLAKSEQLSGRGRRGGRRKRKNPEAGDVALQGFRQTLEEAK